MLYESIYSLGQGSNQLIWRRDGGKGKKKEQGVVGLGRIGVGQIIIFGPMRYSRNRKTNLPQLQHKSSRYKLLVQKQQLLSQQVSRLNQILNADGLYFINDLIFTSQVKNRLPADIMECISKQHRLLSYGFKIWEDSGREAGMIRKEIVQYKPTFKQKLNEISIKSVEKYEEEKLRQLERIKDSRWRVNTTVQAKLAPIRTNKEGFTGISNFTSAKNSQEKATMSYKTVKKMVTEIAEPRSTTNPSQYQIEKMLRKLQDVVSIWLPPKTYPQFYGIVVPSLSKSNAVVRCRIKKYILFKQGMNTNLFCSLLAYLKSEFSTDIDCLQMIMSKGDYMTYFKNCGWKMKSWEGVDKINAVFVPEQ